ncbi:MAG: transcriptional regulator [Paenibacillaceae bacterium ZCTH02-B3]|nr:MAG: transcriptional regulator [Paenibacillaceae bacterium ZCTH02-B3]
MGKQSETAYRLIKDRILDGTYKPTQKLVESQLAEEIGVSRNTIKKALLMLERENLVEIEDNKGATIKSFTLEEIVNYLEIREALEAIVARNVARHITADDIRRLENILAEMRAHLEQHQFEEYSAKNREFHSIIYGASTNRQAVEMINIIRTQLNRYHFRTILVPGRNLESYREHERILEALKSRDPDRIEEAVRHHIASVRRVIEENYQILI